MRRYSLLLLVVILFFTVAAVSLVFAQTDDDTDILPTATPETSVVLAEDVFLRGGPGEEYVPVGALEAGQSIRGVSRNAEATWIMIPYRRGFGWIRRDLAFWVENIAGLPVISEDDLTPTPVGGPSNTPFFPTATPTGNYVNVEAGSAFVRAGPGQGYLRLGQLLPGDPVEPVSRNESTSWIMIRYTPPVLNDFANTITPQPVEFGWVRRDLVEWVDEESLEDLPVIDADMLTPTITFTPSITPSRTPSPTATLTATDTPTLTDTPTVTSTETPSPTATDTQTATSTNTATATSTVTDTPTEEPTATAIPTETPVPTNTPVPPTDTQTPTNTPEPTETDVPPTATDTPESTAVSQAQVIPSETSIPTDTKTSVPSDTPVSPTATLTNTATATNTPTDIPTTTHTATSTETETPIPTETATDLPTATDEATEDVILAQPTDEAGTPPPLPTDTAESTEDVEAVAQDATEVPTLIPEVVEETTDPGSGDSSLPLETIVAGIVLAIVLLYIVFYLFGLRAADRYASGFVVDTCPVCRKGHLHVESRQARLLGIPIVRRRIRCDNCRSVMREMGTRRWRYAVDRIENPAMYDRYNGEIIDERTLRKLVETPIQPVERPSQTPPPSFVGDDDDTNR